MSKIFARYTWLLVLILLTVGLLSTFGWQIQSSTFITHEASVLRLPLLSWWKNIPLIFSRDFLAFTDGQFRPLSYALLAVVRTYVGVDSAVFWHLWLLAFHLLNAFLLFLIVRRFSKHTGSAVLAALLFGLHPLASVVVNNASQFHFALGVTFYLSTLLCYLSFSRQTRNWTYILTLVLFVLGLLTSKIMLTLPIVLVLYEVLYRRSGPRTMVLRILPFTLILLVASPLWLSYKPHPIYYKYIDFPDKAGRYSFFSVVGATGWYLRGLLSGWGVPAVLHEVVGRIFSVFHWRFVLWGLFDLGLLAAGLWALRRRLWAGLGILVIFAGMIPFASTNWNGVNDYLSWNYMYLPSAGLALLVGGLADRIWPTARRGFRTGVLAFLCVLILFYGIQQARINFVSRSPVSYWDQVLRVNRNSEIASVELGKAYIEQGNLSEGLRFLFSPAIKHIQPSSLIMSHYYTAQRDYLSATVHLRRAVQEKDGLQHQDYEKAAAELYCATGVLDHVEDSVRLTLMANPYDVTATELSVRVLLIKGYVPAAERMIERARQIAPSHPATLRMEKALEEYQKSLTISNDPPVIHPPSPDWLRYVTQDKSSPRLQQQIVELSNRAQADPVLQMEAGICLGKSGQADLALAKLSAVTEQLSSCSFAWAAESWAAIQAGEYERAERAGQRALELDPQSPTTHGVLALLYSSRADKPQEPASQKDIDRAIRHYQRAIQLNPKYANAYTNLGNLFRRTSRFAEAERHYRRALELNPNSPEAHNNLGGLLAQQDKLEEAAEHCRQALALKSDISEAHNNMGAILAMQGKADEAVAHLQEALRIQPDYTEALYNLVRVLSNERQFAEVIRLLRERLTQDPNDLSAPLNYAWLLATCPEPSLRNGPEAIRLTERICKATGYRSARALHILAAAYAEAGRLDEAVVQAQNALQIALSSGKAELAKEIKERLELYRTQQSNWK